MYSSGVELSHLTNKSIGASTLALPFPFSFYGHAIDSVFVTTEGFLSLATRVHANMDKVDPQIILS